MLKVSRPQANILQATTRGRIFIGSLGSGKTVVMCLTGIFEAMKSRDCLIASFSYRNLKDVVLPTLVSLATDLNIQYKVNVSDMTFTVNNKVIFLRSADNPDRLRSYNLHSTLIEEAREIDPAAFDVLLGRLRNSEDCFWGIFSSTRGKNWFYDIIRDEKLLDIFDDGCSFKQNENLSIAKCTIDDSPFLPKSYKEDLKKRYTTSFADQELYARIIESTGSILTPSWFKVSSFTPHNNGIRFWDLAVSTKSTADHSASCHLSINDGKIYINNMCKVKLSYPDLKKLIIKYAIQDTNSVHIGIEEAGQQRAIIDDLRRCDELRSFVIRTYRPTKDKITRSYPLASQAELGNVYLNDGPYVREFKDECSNFIPENVLANKTSDDLIDSLTGAYNLESSSPPAVITQLRFA